MERAWHIAERGSPRTCCSRCAARPTALPAQGLPSLLVVVLDRGSPQLLQLATTFLRRLSLYAENCRLLREAEAVAQLASLVPGDGGPLLASVLRLLHNLSFDEGMRQQMVDAGMIAKAAALLRADELQFGSSSAGGGGGGGSPAEGPSLRQLALGLLYHLSLQDKHRSMFIYTGGLHGGAGCGSTASCTGAASLRSLATCPCSACRCHPRAARHAAGRTAAPGVL